MQMTRSLAGAFALAAWLACGPDDQRTDTMDPTQARENMSPQVVAQLDSATAAFRSNDHGAALAHYTRATEMAPDIGAGWFGVYMSQNALGNAEAAADALERARALVPGTTMIHDGGGGGG